MLYFKLSGNNFYVKFEYILYNEWNSELISGEHLINLEKLAHRF